MVKNNLLAEFQNALSIAQAGIKGTVKSLIKSQSKTKKQTARKRTPKKMASAGIHRKPKAKGKTMAKARGLRQSSKARKRKSIS
jgi:hypothetical protein